MVDVLLASTTATDWNSTHLWVSAALPTAGDSIYCSGVSTSITGGPTGTNDVVFASLNFDKDYTGLVGGSTAGLAVMALEVNAGYHFGATDPAGSGRINLNLTGGTEYTATGRITVFDTSASPTEEDNAAVRIVSDSTYHSVEVRKGTVGIATNVAGETATLHAVDVSFVGNVANDAEVHIAPGATLTSYVQTGGDNVLRGQSGTVVVDGGELLIAGLASYTAVTAGAEGKINLETGGTVITLNVAGHVDMSRSREPRTVGNCNLYDGSTFKLDWSVVTLTNGIDFEETGAERCTIEAGNNYTLSFAAI